jgi:hypothetical protein
MNQTIYINNEVDDDGNPAGGTIQGTGLDIRWQSGPLGQGDEQQEPNGAMLESVITAAISRLLFFQNSKFSCRENALALTKLEEALHWLNARTARRIVEGKEGTNEV